MSTPGRFGSLPVPSLCSHGTFMPLLCHKTILSMIVFICFFPDYILHIIISLRFSTEPCNWWMLGHC